MDHISCHKGELASKINVILPGIRPGITCKLFERRTSNRGSLKEAFIIIEGQMEGQRVHVQTLIEGQMEGRIILVQLRSSLRMRGVSN